MPECDDRLAAPDVYRLAAHLAEKFGCRHLIDLGCGMGVKLAPYAQTYQLIGIDKSRAALDVCIQQYPGGLWIEHDLGSEAQIAIAQEALEHAVIVCANVVEWLENPHHLLHSLHAMMEHARVCILSTPEWNRSRLEGLLALLPFNVEFTGLTVDDEAGTSRTTWLAVIGNNGWAAAKSAGCVLPNVTAIMTVFNEEDIVYDSIKKLLDQEVFVYVIDNWSTDSSLEQIERCWGHPYFQGVERFPHSGPSPYFRLAALLERVAELSQVLHGDWFIHHDVDEVRVPPWENMGLRQAAHYVETMGFNAIEFTVVNFQPVDNGFTGGDFESYFRYFSFGKELFHFNQVKMWRRLPEQRINFLDTGGHIAGFRT